MQIVIENVSKSYGKVLAVDNVSLEVDDQIFGLIGPNGAGKTTIIRMLCGLLRPDSGTASIANIDCWRDPFKVKQQVSFLHETAEYPIGISAQHYLEFVGRIRGLDKNSAKHQAAVLLEQLGLSKHANRWIVSYSKGMKQLVGIAASFMGNPKAIILDEPTANLDPNGRLLVLDLIKQWFTEKGVTFFISSHILHELERVSTKVAFLFQGKLVAQGSPMQVLGDLPPTNKAVIRTTKLDAVLKKLKELFPDMKITQQESSFVVTGLKIEEISRRVHQVLQECDAVMLEFKLEEDNLEYAFKELARRFQ